MEVESWLERQRFSITQFKNHKKLVTPYLSLMVCVLSFIKLNICTDGQYALYILTNKLKIKMSKSKFSIRLSYLEAIINCRLPFLYRIENESFNTFMFYSPKKKKIVLHGFLLKPFLKWLSILQSSRYCKWINSRSRPNGESGEGLFEVKKDECLVFKLHL